ncbi:helix-turn-helix transcriptional regulator [Rhizobium puerariae]|uniref:Helix-turn-helix transcriptional regulator n=1 Tax=Rhizobium puerariae TaxID=1585791 RepID=A0ABV6AGV7_9HYPH
MHKMRNNSETGAEPRLRNVSPHDLSELIGSIYDCVLVPSHWEQTLTDIMQALSGVSVILSLNDLRNDRILIDKSIGWGAAGLAERQRHLSEVHARIGEWFARGPSLDEPFIASRQLGPDYLHASPYVQHCLKPLGIVDIMHQFLMYTPSHFSELVIGRHERQGAITDREVEIAGLLLPHLRRAVTITNVLDAGAIERERISEALDALRCGFILTSGEGKILHANRAAERLLEDGAAVYDANGVLAARAPDAGRELRKAIRLAARDEGTLGKTGLAVCLSGSQALPMLAHVLPINGSDLRARLRPEAVAAVFVPRPVSAGSGLPPDETKEFLRRRFGLTKAEADVALEIAKGDGRDAAGARLGITATTVRAHLSNIFEKTGVRRQAELVRLLMQSNAA